MGGHLGCEKTLEKVKECFIGYAVQEWCQTCAVCAARKILTPKPKAVLQLVSVGYPLELVAVDILGPLPQSEAGNTYILVVEDNRWRHMPSPTRRQKQLQGNSMNSYVDSQSKTTSVRPRTPV